MWSHATATAAALAAIAGFATGSTATPQPKAPIVQAPAGSFFGRSENHVETFAGIPFAKPPVGNLRLQPPSRLDHKLEMFNASGTAPWCTQLPPSQQGLDIINDAVGPGIITIPDVAGQEDCLTITVKRPAGVSSNQTLPVLYWIYGGGYQTGGTEQFDGTFFTAYSQAQQQPFVFVAVNYRLGGFGFLGGREVLADGAANLGLLDQRLGLEWVADNIASFGGDPEKVTIWGESAGSLSVASQLTLFDGNNTYNGKPLFHGAIMNSGSLLPSEPTDNKRDQDLYDRIVDSVGCAGEDSLQCLRSLDHETFRNATLLAPSFLSYESLHLAFVPRPDGRTLTASTDVLFKEGRFAPVPMINGIQEDEGTLFALFPQNVTSSAALVDYLSDITFTNASRDSLEELVDAYPADPAAGSPYRTGNDNQLYTGYKRVAALAGDVLFILQRRLALSLVKASCPQIPTWSYMGSYGYGTPVLGSSHASDLAYFFANSTSTYIGPLMEDYYLNFIYYSDPNGNSGNKSDDRMYWPQWGTNHELMQFSQNSTSIIQDNFRAEAYSVLVKNLANYYY